MKVKHNFKNLKVWQKAKSLAVTVYGITADFPSEEKFGLISQIRRSSVSIPSNIAEGSARNSSKAFSNVLDISLGECFELETQFIIANEIGILNSENFEVVQNRLDEIQKMIIGLKTSIESNPY
jgi:four helix bundle protein